MAVVHYPAVIPPQRPAVSVCIANYNGERLLDDCIGSVLAQDGDAAIEIIVHDDASADGSVALLRERFPQVEVLASGENVGFCIANNRMVAHARGQFVLLLNNDAALFPDAVATLLSLARGLPGPAILTLPQYDWASGALVDRGCMIDPFYNPVPNRDPARAEVAYGIGACLWLPNTLWKELGGFPEWFESIGEDLYLCCLARLRGQPTIVARRSGYRHRQGASFGGNRPDAGKLVTSYRRRSLSERNKTALLLSLTPSPLAWPLLVLHLALLCVEGASLAAIRRDHRIWTRIYWPAIALPVMHGARLMDMRRMAQDGRRAGLRAYLRAMRPIPRKLQLLFAHGLPRIR